MLTINLNFVYKPFIFLLSEVMLIFIISCNSGSNSNINTPNDNSDSIFINIDTTRIDAAFGSAKSNYRIKCLLVDCEDNFYKEEYFVPSSELYATDIMSVTKSVMSLLVGIAIDKGLIPSVNEKIDSYIRPLIPSLDPAKGAISLHHLLSMSCGLEWSEIPGPSEFMDWYYSKDKLQYILNKPLVSSPGSAFNYSDGAAHLVSVVLTQATGLSAKEFGMEHLFNYLEIENPTWTIDNRGFNYGGVRLCLLPKDMLKVGKLMLHKGVYNGIRIVSEEWINISTAFKIANNNVIPYSSSYGYFWWRGSNDSYQYYFANGYGGQFIFIVPEISLIVVGTTNFNGLSDSAAGQLWYELISIIVNQILDSFDYSR